MRRLAALALAPLLAAAPAAAQMVHGVVQGPPPLDERVAQADAAAIATVESVAGGRIVVDEATAVLGDVPATFELKRRPSAPLPLAAGDRVLLLLRGERAPYLVVDRPEDTVRIADAAAAARWSEAIRAVAGRSGDREALRTLYVAWTDGDDDALRAEALRALARPAGPFLPIPPPLAMERARVAVDATRTPAVRSAAATLAVQDPEALDWLLVRTAAAPDVTQPELSATLVRAGLTRGRPGAARALTALLRSPDAAVRLAGLGVARAAPPEWVKGELETLAAGDPDPRVREEAAHAVARLAKPPTP